jgi:adsorption protein B
MAVREFFPKQWGTALRQRTRWVTGSHCKAGAVRVGRNLQRGVLVLARSQVSQQSAGFIANAVFVYGVVTRMWTRLTPLAIEITSVTLAFQMLRIAVRMTCVARVYGMVFALGVPLRLPYANLLNAAATVRAVVRYGYARMRGLPLRWVKTEHSYPTRAALLGHKRPLGEILVGLGYLNAATLHSALAACPQGTRLGEFLVASGTLKEDLLYEALSLQQGPVTHVGVQQVSPRVARALPERVAREWRILPFEVAKGALLVATPELPTPPRAAAVRSFTALEVRFHLVTPSEYRHLVDALL